MKLKPLHRFVFFSISLLAAFALGHLNYQAFFSRGNIKHSPNNPQINSTSKESNLIVSNFGDRHSSRSSYAPSDSSKTEMLDAIASDSNVLFRSNATLALIETLNSDDFPSALKALERTSIVDSQRPEYALLLAAWAEVDPHQAIRYASEGTNAIYVQNTVLKTWASFDPEGALEWAEANHSEANEANPWLVSVIQGVIANDVDFASSLMTSMQYSDTPDATRDQALNAILDHLYFTDPSSARNWAAEISEPGLRTQACATIAMETAREDPEKAAVWLDSLNDVNSLMDAAEKVAQSWYLENPEAAKAWTLTLPYVAIANGVKGIAQIAAEQDPLEAAQWMNDIFALDTGANFDGSIRELVVASAPINPELSAEWIAGISNAKEQAALYHQVLRDWADNEPINVITWIEQNSEELPDSVLIKFHPDYTSNEDFMDLGSLDAK